MAPVLLIAIAPAPGEAADSNLTHRVVAPGIARDATGQSAPVPTPTSAPGSSGAIVPTLASSSGTRALLTIAGGTITATGPQGTRYSLLIPADALATATEITMTPLSALPGLPMSGGLAGGVRLEPEGLQLYKAAILTIEPAGGTAGSFRAYAYQANGDEFHFYPLGLEPGPLKLQITHFSGYGAGTGIPTSTPAPASAEASAEQAVSDVIADAKASGADTLGTGPTQQVTSILRSWFENSVLPQLEGGMASDAAADLAIRQALAWWKMVQESRLEDEFSAELQQMWDMVEKVIKAAYDRARQSCASSPAESGKMVRWARVAAILEQGEPVIDIEQLERDLQKCLRFRLEFESQVTTTEEYRQAAHVEARNVELLLVWSTIGLEGKGVFSYVSVEIEPSYAGCTVVASGNSVPLEIMVVMEIPPAEIPPDATPPMPIIHELLFDPGFPLESFTETCPDSDPPTSSGAADVFLTAWAALHEDELVAGPAVTRIRDWEPGVGSLIARKTYSRSGQADGVVVTENTTFSIFHDPIP